MMGEVRVLELYSGIGGMHYAFKESGVPAQVVAAVDINTIANQIYKHNFPETPLWNKTIEGITLDDFNKLSFDMITMSPPCQPFTRIGLQGDVSDSRTKSFLYILDVLPRLEKLPRFILLENVKGFETSSARERLLKTLTNCGYTFQEIMVSPTSVGIPNSRLRYFLLAQSSAGDSDVQINSQICDAFPPPAESAPPQQPSVLSPTCRTSGQTEEEVHGDHVLYKRETAAEVEKKLVQNNDPSVRQIQDFLEPQMDVNMEPYLLPPKTLLRYAPVLDIVQPNCRSYGRYVEGTGSVLQTCMETQIDAVFSGLDQLSEEEKLQQLLKLKLRYFTPREVANLMGFPHSFSFPQQISTIQKYRVLGNSLNVVVVSKLIQLLLTPPRSADTTQVC
ncbi:tRNA (cytosine(38)-C(5))-methyltransferase isoform X2 [Melanotaenia boesemani]|uniref:tRNA (cytosine(38)-C(5))-methyltransferase isoform X2 n=1 Tax=Melanotaenia boesemani TaxID=1250792 RepID=UPI001C045DF5|nr:tRNA (cytosine(38)-C(5))-methyltransferase isoform X2 [Melanotaenia boesemani]